MQMSKVKSYNYPDGDNYYVSNDDAPRPIFVSSFTKPLFDKHERPPIGFKTNKTT